MRVFWGSIFLAICVSCAASNSGVKEYDAEAEIRKSEQAFNARNPYEQQMTQQSMQESFETATYATATKPSIMVLPEGGKNIQECQNVLKTNRFARTAVSAIHDYLTEKQYNVKSLNETQQINDVVNLQNELAGEEEDLSYVASLSFGADIYIKFSGEVQPRKIIANVSAYESTTGRVLGSQSSTVNDNGTRKEELLLSAVHKAMPGLEKKIQAYWAEDSKIGTQYKVVLNYAGDPENADESFSRIARVLRNNFAKVETNSMTSKTGDFTVYAKANSTADAFELYDQIRTALKASFQVKKINLTKKLIILEVQ